MIAYVLTIVAISFVDCNNCTPSPEPAPPNIIPSSSYPNPKRDDTVQDTYGNNVVIKDPYRWMENPDSPETKKFIQDEMAITKPYLEKSPFRAELQARYKELADFPKFSGPFQAGNKFYSYQNTGLQNQNVLFVHDSYKDEGKVFIDPNTFSKDGTVAMKAAVFSDDGSIVAYMTSASGSDWSTIQFKNVEKGDIYQDKLTKVKYSNIAWTHNNKGIFYSGYLDQNGNGSENNANKNHKLYYHELGTDPSKDIMVAEYPENPDNLVIGEVSDDGKYLIVIVADGTNNNLIYLADLDKIKYVIKSKLDLIPIVTKMDKKYGYLTNIEKTFIFQTNQDADNFKLIKIDITNPDSKSWKDLVPANEKDVLSWASVAFEKYMILAYIQNVKTVLQLHELATGKIVKTFPLEIGTVDDDGIFCDKKFKDIFINFQSLLTPGIVYHCDLSNPAFELENIKEIKLKNFDRNKYTVEQVHYKSKDGTEIPMYITHKKEFQKNGNHFAFMTGYGAYGISTLPYFAVNRLVVIDNCDGVHAVPNIRGGGELGDKWHWAGALDKKQNTFDDFQAAAEFLIAEKYTNNKLLTIQGGSAGGLMMGACLNQRPDLFGAVIGDVGPYDMLRYDKFVGGHGSVSEFGTSSKPEDFAYLIKYSPLHNIKIPAEADKQYPATMLSTADHDDRVPPLHSLKFTAELQFQAKSHPNQKNPFILKVDTDAGHGGGKPLDKVIADFVDMMCFIILNTGIKFNA